MIIVASLHTLTARHAERSHAVKHLPAAAHLHLEGPIDRRATAAILAGHELIRRGARVDRQVKNVHRRHGVLLPCAAIIPIISIVVGLVDGVLRTPVPWAVAVRHRARDGHALAVVEDAHLAQLDRTQRPRDAQTQHGRPCHARGRRRRIGRRRRRRARRQGRRSGRWAWWRGRVARHSTCAHRGRWWRRRRCVHKYTPLRRR